MAKRISLKITMLSDWHIGAGSGRSGNIDSLVRRDADGFPYIPGKTLVGVIRDACETVADSLGVNWPKYAELLFGSQPALSKETGVIAKPTPAALALDSAYYPKSIRIGIENKPALRNALTFVKPGVAIDPETGRSKEDFLRFQEMARAGGKLFAEGYLDLSGYDDDTQKNALALLYAGCKFVDQLGGKRRRGAGRCRIEFDIPNGWKETLEKGVEEPVKTDTDSEEVIDTKTGDKVTYKLTIETLSPVAVTSRVVGNVNETHKYIPGTYFLPVLSSLFGKGYVTNAIMSNSLAVTNAYPAINGDAALPVPFCLFSEKLNDENVVNRALLENTLGKQLKQWRGDFVTFGENDTTIHYAEVETQLVTHNAVDDDTQRPEEAAVYSIQSIAPGNKFIAYLTANRDDLGGVWDNIRLGTAKRSEYGAVSVRAEKQGSNTAPSGRPTKGNELTLWLVSDALILDDKLRLSPTAEALRKELEAKLGVTLKSCSDGKLLKTSARQTRVDSWQTRWALPRPSLVGLAAGSYLTFEVEGDVSDDRLRKIEAEGIGERTAEGFGRIIFNPHFSTSDSGAYTKMKPKASTGSESVENTCLTDEDKPFICTLQKIALRSMISNAALQYAGDKNNRKKALGIDGGKPNNSQLGALRMWAMRLADDKSNVVEWEANVKKWLESLEKRNATKELWPVSSLEKPKSLLLGGVEVWKHLDADINWDSIAVTDDAAKDCLKDEMWPLALKSLVDATVRGAAAARQKAESGGQTTGGQTNGTAD